MLDVFEHSVPVLPHLWSLPYEIFHGKWPPNYATQELKGKKKCNLVLSGWQPFEDQLFHPITMKIRINPSSSVDSARQVKCGA